LLFAFFGENSRYNLPNLMPGGFEPHEEIAKEALSQPGNTHESHAHRIAQYGGSIWST
jgi:hypothetical protein